VAAAAAAAVLVATEAVAVLVAIGQSWFRSYREHAYFLPECVQSNECQGESKIKL
jgi:hypothetical protein